MKRTVRDITGAALLLAVLLAAAACGGDDTDGAVMAETTADTGAATVAVDDGREALVLPEDLSLEGKTFHYLSYGPEGNSGYYITSDLWVAEENGEPLNDAVFRRNRAVEEKLGITIMTTEFGDPAAEIRKIVTADDCPYDAVWAGGNEMYSLAAEGYFFDFNEIPNITLTNPWWDQNIIDNYSFFDRNYIMTGDISTRDDACTCFLYFNKKLIAENDMTSPYELVSSGEWTLDKLSEMVHAATRDLNGDGELTDGDRFGIYSEGPLPNRMFISMGGTYYTRDGDDYRINITDERNINIYTGLFDLLLHESAPNIEKWKNTGSFSNVYTYARSLFAQDCFLFVFGGPLVIGEFRDMESDFGIVPVPKFDASEDRYYAVVDEHAPLLAVTVNAPDIAKTGAVLETLSWESMYTLTPVYNETLVKRKYTCDEDSIAMLEILADSRVYNITAMTNWGGLNDVASSRFNSKKMIAVSDFEKKVKAAEKALEKDLEYFAEAAQ
ncbi:MAG: hypothetical protein IJ302_06315 [Clostridia bacterium]|nr:hypothetical protein [Clostridia bacterium]